MRTQRWVCGLIAGAALGSVTGGAAAQSGRVWLEPRVGWQVPTRDLGRTDVLALSGFGQFERPDAAPVLGIGVGVKLGSRWAVRLSGDRSVAGVQGEWRCAPFVACPAVLLPVDGELTRWNTSLDLLFQPMSGLPLEPSVFAGVGVRRSLLDWSEPAADVTLPAFSFDDTEAVVRMGLGLQRSLGWARVFGEVEASSTRFGGRQFDVEGNTTTTERPRLLDVGFSGGLRIHLP